MKSQLAAVMERTKESEHSTFLKAVADRWVEDWFRAESELLHPVPLNVTESDGEYIVRAEVPGFGSKDIEVIVEPLYLAISGRRDWTEDKANGKVICSESRAERIFRVLDLPSVVDISKVSTTLKDGILIVDLPKVQNAEKVYGDPIAA
jgi:HSP20 family protein